MLFWKSGSKKQRILTVDDSAAMLIILKKQLEEMGYEALQAPNGPDGLKLAESQKPDLILLDVTMPVMSGLDVLVRLKQNPKTASIPVVMCSSEQTGKDLDEAFRGGALGYVIKPYTPERLKEKITKALPPPQAPGPS